MSKAKLFQQWMIAYPHLTVLILTSPTLPRPLQADVSRALLKVIQDFQTQKETQIGAQNVRVNPYWNYFLYHHHRQQWTDAYPDLHTAFSKLDCLPPVLLIELDKGCEGLNTYFQIQTLTQTICLLDSRQRIFHCLSVPHDLIHHAVELCDAGQRVVSLPLKVQQTAHARMR